jgi:hypothetical protein
VAQYRDPVLRQCLPLLEYASENTDGAVRSKRGFVLPPFLVIERGMTLTEWMMQARGGMEVRSVLFISSDALLVTCTQSQHMWCKCEPTLSLCTTLQLMN